MKCALCNDGDRIEDSHIIPKMVYRWLKKASITGHLRGTTTPNLRIQDGPKIKLLCPDCEDRFSEYESEFSKHAFYPIHSECKNDHSFDYGKWLHRFAVSVSWRSLHFLSLQVDNSTLPFNHDRLADNSLEIWRQYLNDERNDIGKCVQHMIVLDEVSSTKGLKNDSELNQFIHRGIDFNTIHSKDEAYIFSKLGKIVIVGVIAINDPNIIWKNTVINPYEGNYAPGDTTVSSCFYTFLETGIQTLRDARQRISDKQLERMKDTLFKQLGKSSK